MITADGQPSPGPAAGEEADGAAAVEVGGKAALLEQRDQLLRSLAQLDSEHEAGDLDDDDHRRLADGYTARLAAVLRRIDSSGPAPAPAPHVEKHRAPQVIIGVALLVFSLGAGLLLARASGERGVRDQITGGIDGSSRNQVIECQQLGSTGGDLVGALECFDEILARDASNAEALSYRGWYLLLAAGALQDAGATDTGATDAGSDDAGDTDTGATGAGSDNAGDTDAGSDDARNDDAVELIASSLTYLDRAIEADPTLPDPLAFRAAVFDRLGQSDLVCADIAALLALEPPEFFLTQTASLAARNRC